MNGSILLGTIARIEVRIHSSFLLLLALWAGMRFAQSGLQAAIDTTLFIVLVFICVLLHELGHAYGAWLFRIRTSQIELNFFGGLASLEREPRTPLQEAVIALSGPLVNLLIAGILYLMLVNASSSEWLLQIVRRYNPLIYSLMWANIILGCFNLLPGFPLDGGSVLRAILSTRLTRMRARYIVGRMGQIIAVALGLYGFATQWLFTMAIALFLFMLATAEVQHTKPAS